MKNIIKASHKQWIIIFFSVIGATLGVIIGLTGSKFVEWRQEAIIVNDSVEKVASIKEYLKEPNSLRLYEGSYKVRFENLKTTVYLIKFDSKNGFGAYGGKRYAEILDLDYAPIAVLTDYDKKYIGLIDGIEGRTSINLEELEVTPINTKKLSKKLNCEYME